MNYRSTLSCASTFFATILLAACGGGGNSADVTPGAHVTTTVTGPNSYLLAPNPLVLTDGSYETNTVEYATAYYAAIDPTNAKDTLPKWKAANNIGAAPLPLPALGEVQATFGDTLDLGYGRRLTARENAGSTFAFVVDNYKVDAGGAYGYNTLNVEAAVVQDTRWHVGTNAIEYSPGPNGGSSFAKFYTFDPTPPYARRLVADLDGRGAKALPNICINCHGGRADPLTPVDATTGKKLFALVQNSASQHRGDVQARLNMFKADSFGYSATLGYRRLDLEASIKTLNKMVLCTYPLPGGGGTGEDACRPTAAPHEWQGVGATALKAAYGGAGLPNTTFSNATVPDNWLFVGQSSLYSNAVQKACITCHTLRGTKHQDDLDFSSYAKFQGYSDRIKAHVIERGNMPLAKLVSDNFWSTASGTSMAQTLGTWLNGLGLGYVVLDSGNVVLAPGRPIADPGPSRTVRFGPNTLSAANSLYSSSYLWSITTNPGSAGTLSSLTSATPTFTATANGTYVLQLITSNGVTQSLPVSLTLVVNNALAYDPAALRFTDIKSVLQTGGGGCTTCHQPGGNGIVLPPIFYSDTDRDGNGAPGEANDTAWFYAELRGRVNFLDISSSKLLRKPAGFHHAGLLRPGFDSSLVPGAAGRADYDMILNWIVNGAPE